MVTSEVSSGPNPGPHGLGDPKDKRLRKVEMDVLIPKKMREKAKVEKCSIEVSDFLSCCKDNGVAMVLKCRSQNAIMKDCLTKWYQNEEFRKLCTEEYLKERTEYRATGITKRMRERNLL